MKKYFTHNCAVRFLLAINFCSLLSSGCAGRPAFYYSAPSVLPFTQRVMKSPGFWISQLSSPDAILLKPEKIAQLNKNIQDELHLTQDITQITEYPREKLRSELEKTLDGFLKRGLFTSEGSRFHAGFFNDIQSNINLDAIDQGIKLRFGLIVHYADQRLLPTRNGLYALRGDIDFDEIQNSALDVGTPVAVYHQSKDSGWLYVVSPSSSGWVEVRNIAFCSLEELKNFLSLRDFIVVIKPKADIFLDQSRKQFYDYARMGVRFAVQNINEEAATIMLPLRNDEGSVHFSTGYIQTKDTHEGFLAYTPRNMIEQAFELLNTPYGWGGMYGEQDCSAFLQEIFSTAGIHLPRNSSAQAKVGKLFGEFDKNVPSAKKMEVLSQDALGGATILSLKGHIMLFLGMLDGRPYAIHETWGYREHGWWRDRVRILNRVVVSDLSLGEGSHKGSLLERLWSVRLVGE